MVREHGKHLTLFKRKTLKIESQSNYHNRKGNQDYDFENLLW